MQSQEVVCGAYVLGVNSGVLGSRNNNPLLPIVANILQLNLF